MSIRNSYLSGETRLITYGHGPNIYANMGRRHSSFLRILYLTCRCYIYVSREVLIVDNDDHRDDFSSVDAAV